jgi:hypothetical protein
MASAQDKPPLVVRAEKCLADNVDRVVTAEPDVQSAASFLVSFACPAEVERVATYERNLAAVRSFAAMTKAMRPVTAQDKSTGVAKGSASGPMDALFPDVDATVDPETGEIVVPPQKPGEPANMFSAMLPQVSSSASQLMPPAPPASLRKLAGELVLAARERQLAKRR